MCGRGEGSQLPCADLCTGLERSEPSQASYLAQQLVPCPWARRPGDFRGHRSGKAAQQKPVLALAAETEDNRRCLLTHNANVDTLKLHLQAAGLVCIKAAFKSPIFWYSVLRSSKVAAASSSGPGRMLTCGQLGEGRSGRATPPDLESPTAEYLQAGESSGPYLHNLQVWQCCGCPTQLPGNHQHQTHKNMV